MSDCSRSLSGDGRPCACRGLWAVFVRPHSRRADLFARWQAARDPAYAMPSRSHRLVASWANDRLHQLRSWSFRPSDPLQLPRRNGNHYAAQSQGLESAATKREAVSWGGTRLQQCGLASTVTRANPRGSGALSGDNSGRLSYEGLTSAWRMDLVKALAGLSAGSTARCDEHSRKILMCPKQIKLISKLLSEAAPRSWTPTFRQPRL